MRRIGAMLLSAGGVIAAVIAALVANAPVAAAVTPTCVVGPALFGNPFASTSAERFTALQVDQHGVWGGVAYDGTGDFEVLSWRRGAAPHVISTVFDYHRVPGYDDVGRRTIDVVGVTPSGAVVAGIQAQTAMRHWPFAWWNGHRYQLHTPSNWRDVQLLTVTDTGRIIGYGVVGSPAHPGYVVASWAGITAAPQRVIYLTSAAESIVADQRGDLAWTATTSDDVPAFKVRLASGTIRNLAPGRSPDSAFFTSAAGAYVFAGTDVGTLRWNLGSIPSTGPIPGRAATTPPPGYSSTAVAASAAGGVVWGGNVRWLKLPSAISVRIPDEHHNVGAEPVYEAMTPDNKVAFTAEDRLVHLLTCR